MGLSVLILGRVLLLTTLAASLLRARAVVIRDLRRLQEALARAGPLVVGDILIR